MSEQNLALLIEQAKALVMDEEQSEAQRKSFVYGNTRIENSAVTWELVEAISRRM